MTLVGLGTLEGGILMRIPDYRNVHGVKDPNHWTPKANRVDKAHEDEFEKELEDSIHKRKSEEKTKIEKETQKKHPALIDESQELDEMELEIDHLFSEYDKKIKSVTDIDLDEETPNNSDQFSSWA